MDYASFGFAVVAIYLLTALLSWKQIVGKFATQISPQLLASPALLAHLALLLSGLFLGVELDLSMTKLISLMSLSIASVLTLGHRRFNSLLLLPPIYLFNAVALIPDLFNSSHYFTNLLQNSGLAVHVGLALIAYCILIMAALMAVQVWVIDYRLKNHGPLQGLPPLIVVDKQLRALLHTGFLFLTASILVGWLFLDDFFASGQRHKALFTIIAWLIYGGILWKDKKSGLSSRQMAILSIVSGAILTLAYFGSRFVKEVLLN